MRINNRGVFFAVLLFVVAGCHDDRYGEQKRQPAPQTKRLLNALNAQIVDRYEALEGESVPFRLNTLCAEQPNQEITIQWDFGTGDRLEGSMTSGAVQGGCPIGLFEVDLSSAPIVDGLSLVTPAYVYTDSGSFQPTFTARTDAGAEMFTETLDVTIAEIDPVIDGVIFDAPVFVEGVETTIEILAASNSDADVITEYIVDWGDGNQTMNAGATPAHTFADNGQYTLIITVRDEDSEVSTTRVIEVQNRPPQDLTLTTLGGGDDQLTFTEGTTVLTLLTWTDAAGDTFSVSSSACPDPSQCLVGNAAIECEADNEECRVNRQITYLEAGVYTMSNTVLDDDGDSASLNSVFTITDAQPVIEHIEELVVEEGEQAVIEVTAISGADDAAADPITTFTFDCENNGFEDNVAQLSNIGRCSFSADGQYSVPVRVSDEDSSSTATATVIVTNAAPRQAVFDLATITVAEGDAAQFPTATFLDPGQDAVSATWVFEDPIQGPVNWPAVVAEQAAPGLYSVEAAAPYTFVDDQTGADENDRIVRVCLILRDDDISVESGCLDVVLENRPPSIDDVSLSNPLISENAAMSLTVRVSDPALTAGATAAQEPLKYTFEWGDGSADTVQMNQPFVSHNFAAPGDYNVNVVVEDDDGGRTVETVAVQVVNVAPEIASIVPIGELKENQAVSLAIFLKDQDVGSLEYKVDWGDGTSTDWQAEPTMSHTYLQDGTYTITVSVTDNVDVVSDTIDLNIANVAPALSIEQPSSISVGQTASLSVRAVDTEADVLSFDVDWFGNGQFVRVEPVADGDAIMLNSPAYLSAGNYPVRVRVMDDDTVTQMDTLLIVHGQPAPISIAALVPSGRQVEAGLMTVTAVLEQNDSPNVQYRWDWGDGEVTDWSPSSSAAHAFEQDGIFAVTVSARDDNSEVSEVLFLEIANVPPRVLVDAVTAVSEGEGVNVTVRATDVPADAITFQVDWFGYGVFRPVFAVLDNDTIILGSPTYQENGVYQIRIRAFDDDTYTEVSTVVTVRDAAPTITRVVVNEADEGSPTTLEVEASDTAGDALFYDVEWGDGQSSGPSQEPRFQHTYARAGSYQVTITVVDSAGLRATAHETAVVENIAPRIISVEATSPVTLGSVAGVTVHASDPGTGPLTYRWDFDGDGEFEQVSDLSNVGLHTMVDEGIFRINVEVSDGISTARGHAVVTVVEPAVRLTVTQIGVANEGQEVELDIAPRGTGPFDIQIDWNGDGIFEDRGITDITEVGVTAVKRFADNLDVEIAVRVVDRGFENYAAHQKILVKVGNLPPTFTSDAPLVVASDGIEYRHQFAAEDPAGAADPLTYLLVSGPDGVVVSPDGQLTWIPSYRDAENRQTISVQVNDGDGGSDTQTWTVSVVVNDTDGDDLPDAWELENFGNLSESDGRSDSDADGIVDLDELANGLDPNVNDAPAAPVSIHPVGAIVRERSPTLVVRNAEYGGVGTLVYTFELSDNEFFVGEPIFFATVDQGEGTTAIQLDVQLQDGEKYWWRAKASDQLTDGPDSAVHSFTVQVSDQAPTTPVASVPVDGAVVATLRPFLEVQGAMDPEGTALAYDFEIYAEESLETLVASVEGRAIPAWFVDVDLLDGMQYWWIARAFDGQNSSRDSEPSSFSIELPVENTAPSAPLIRAPALDAVVETLTPSLVVEASSDGQGDTLSYWFEVSSNPLFAGTDVQLSMGRAGTSWTPNALVENRQYYWRVRASDGQSVSDWSIGRFRVNAENQAPSAPMVLTPANGALLYTAPVSFSVQNATDVEGDQLTYTFVLSNEPNFSAIMATSVDLAEGQRITTWRPDDELLFVEGETYYWRAMAYDGDTMGPPSETASFSLPVTVDTQSLIDEATSHSHKTSGCSVSLNTPSDSELLWYLLLCVAALRRRR